MHTSLHRTAVWGPPACWRGLRPAALQPAGRRLPRPHLRTAAAACRVSASAAESPQQPQRGSLPADAVVQSVAAQRQQREWGATCQLLAAFQETHGRLPRHSNEVDGERRLAAWCTVQRRRKEGSAGSPLSAEERAALEAVPGWQWLARRQPERRARVQVRVPWEQRLEELITFQQQLGRLPRLKVSPNSPNPPLPGEKELGAWVDMQRQRWKGKQGTRELSPQQQADLEAVPGWVWEGNEPWHRRLKQLAAFVGDHGQLPRQVGSGRRALLEGERELASWVGLQRQRRKGNKQGGGLTVAQQAALEAIPGWCWEEWSVEEWDVRLERVKAFQQQHGRLPRLGLTPNSALPPVPGERELGTWIGHQRQRWKGGGQQVPFTQQQIAALEAIPGWVWEEHTPWEQRVQQVAAFQQQHGPLPRKEGGKQSPLLEGEQQLGLWCSTQRQRRKGDKSCGGELTAAQQAALEAIPGWWWDEGDAWQERLAQVAAFAAQHGWLPRRAGGKQKPLLEGELELGAWCSRQRQRAKGNRRHGGELANEQLAALEAIPGWVW